MGKIKVPDIGLTKYDTPAINRVKKKVVQRTLFGESPKQDIRAQITEIDLKIKQLRFDRAVLQSELKAKRNKHYVNRKFQLYALKLEDNCWYIGSSWSPHTRFVKHKKGKGANWTKLHRPIEIVEIRDTDTVFQDDVHLQEDDMTIEYALKYGSDTVRGGGYCQHKPHWPQVVVQNELPL